ncbi:MAG: hypothetical protein MJ072_05525 [Clostridia bacterium]|nr:hypothetical protein [Clostridia bacterium]
MKNEKINAEILNQLYKNAHVALQSISDLSPEVDDNGVKEQLLTEYEAYEKIIGDLSSYMEEKGVKREDIGVMKKAMLWTGIKMKTLTGADDNKVADMMIQGATMGINELTALKNSEVYDEKTGEFVERLITLEQNSVDNWRKYL